MQTTNRTGSRLIRGLNVSVIYNNEHRKCANGGLTEQYEDLWVVPNQAIAEALMLPFIPDDAHNLVVTSERGGLVNLIPYEQPSGMCGPMAGGSYAHTSDSRWRKIVGVGYPVAVHDRFETVEHNRALSI